MKTAVLSIFIATYAGLLLLPGRKTLIGVLGAAAALATGVLPFREIPYAIDWNVLMMIFGTSGVVMLLIESRATELAADILIERMPNVKWAAVSLAVFAGAVSAFLENVSTLLVVAPIAMAIAARLKFSPVPMLIAIAVSSNLQGAATLVGDPTAIMMAGHAGMNFMDFFAFKGRPGIFFAVELGALASTAWLAFVFRKETGPIDIKRRVDVRDWFPTLLLAAMIAALIAASFIPNKPPATNGFICLAAVCAGVAVETIRSRSPRAAAGALRKADWHTLALLACLFILIAAVVNAGILDDIAMALAGIGGNNVFLLYSIVVWGSVLVSAFVDNIPYVAVMLPVVGVMAREIGVPPHLFYFGLLTGATLGGNMTPIGASTNIAALGILRKHGHEVKFLEFAKIGAPFTLFAVTASYVFIWLVWRNA